MQGHGAEKFKDASLIATSAQRPWSALSAELRSHNAGEISAFVPQNAEITMIVQGPKPAISSRASGGVKQIVPALPQTTWLCPAGICEEATRLSDDIPEVLHVYIPQHTFFRMRDFDGFSFRANDLRYQAKVENPDVLGMMAAIIDELRSESFAGGLRMDALACALVGTLAREHAETQESARSMPQVRGGLDRNRLGRVIEYINANLDRDITVAELARVANFSLYHFARAFHISVGRSPHAYLAERRLDMAKQLLAYGTMALADVADACCFSSQANFSKAFQKATGFSPGKYRRFALS
ncbi:helix-turn-helix domain-containing protein [Azospirillum picis]|uniref:AraC family transcriptional regulator n=1 Tax=Azospirillum picis TaxID=488438 RepID=A0ABU0MR80_9PROT|nr:AraC family transcriptional regulator [Azospirillum picis]MBP2302403.1 AraC family transcriptional regulator [Azospirillum picis]MDQ0535982.1 AraC family transcriptional regulator [Azospirillum picis]